MYKLSKRAARVPLIAAVMLGLAPVGTGHAVTINVTEVSPGDSFWNGFVAQPQPATTVGSGSLLDSFEAAAQVWERIFPEPFDLNIQVGWARPSDINDYWVQARPAGIGSTPARDPDTHRWNAGMVFFTTDPTKAFFYLNPSPASNTGYGPEQTLSANLGGGWINTGRYRFGTTVPPLTGGSYVDPCLPTSQCIPTGAVLPEYGDLRTDAIHEIGHMLGLDYLPVLSDTSPLYHNNGASALVTDSGPYSGMTIPYTIGAGPHIALTYPTGVSNLDPAGQWVPTPDGVRRVYRADLSDAETVMVGELGKWHEVRLGNGTTYATYPVFSQAQRTLAGLTLNGDAASLNGVGAAPGLHLTADLPEQAGSAFLSNPFTLGPSSQFESEFGFRIGGVNGSGPQGSDGLAFILQRDPRGPHAIGNDGEGLGFGNNPTFGDTVGPILPSLALEFDTHGNSFDPSGNHIGLVMNGNVAGPLLTFSPGFDLNDGLEHFAWLDYGSGRLSVYLSDTDLKPGIPDFTTLVDLSSLWGNDAYFGFSAATGDGFNYHDILEWNLQVSSVPEPATMPLVAAAIAVLAVFRRRHITRQSG